MDSFAHRIYTKVVQIDTHGAQSPNYSLANFGISGVKNIWVDVSKSYRRYNNSGYTFADDGKGYIPVVYYINPNDWSTAYINANGVLQLWMGTTPANSYCRWHISLNYTKA